MQLALIVSVYIRTASRNDVTGITQALWNHRPGSRQYLLRKGIMKKDRQIDSNAGVTQRVRERLWRMFEEGFQP